MHSSSEYDSLTSSNFLFTPGFGDRQHIYFIASQSFTNSLLCHKLTPYFVIHQQLQVLAKLRMSVGVTIRKITILTWFNLTLKTELIVISTRTRARPFKIILTIHDLRTRALPFKTTVCLFKRSKNSHSIVK